MAKNPATIAMGPIFIGCMFNVCLFGVMITQVYLYFNTYKTDRRWMKCLVLFIFLADTVNAVFDLVYVYNSLVVHFGELKAISTATWVFSTDPAMTGIISTAVQLFFAWRVRVITNSNWFCAPIIFFAFAGLLGGIGTAIAVSMYPIFTQFVQFKVIVIIWLVASAVADVFIACILTYHLRKHKTGFQATDDIVNRIIRVTVQTGAVTALCATMDLIFYLVDTSGNHLIFNIPLSKLYTNSMMSSLNSRGGWKFQRSNDLEFTSTGNVVSAKSRTDVVQLSTNNTRPEVFVTVESHEMADAEDKISPNFGDVDSDRRYRQRQWEGGDVKEMPIGSVV